MVKMTVPLLLHYGAGQIAPKVDHKSHFSQGLAFLTSRSCFGKGSRQLACLCFKILLFLFLSSPQKLSSKIIMQIYTQRKRTTQTNGQYHSWGGTGPLFVVMYTQ